MLLLFVVVAFLFVSLTPLFYFLCLLLSSFVIMTLISIGKAVSNKLLVYHPKSLKKSERGGGFFFLFCIFLG